jgi:capsular polysaccharide transport system permease protein
VTFVLIQPWSDWLGPALCARRRAIGAIVMREAKAKTARHKLGFLWELVDPAVQAGAMAGIAVAVGRAKILDIDAGPFIAVGLLPYMMFNRIFAKAMGAVEGNRVLLEYPVVHPVDAIIARTILEGLTTAAGGFTVFFGLIALDLAIPFPSPAAMILSLSLAAVLGMGLGTAAAAALPWVPAIEHLSRVVLRILYFLSGIFYGLDTLPQNVAAMLWWNPILHLADLCRAGAFPHYEPLLLDGMYPLMWTLLSLALGLGAYRLTDASAEGWRTEK